MENERGTGDGSGRCLVKNSHRMTGISGGFVEQLVVGAV
jgi:hypothetical protein